MRYLSCEVSKTTESRCEKLESYAPRKLIVEKKHWKMYFPGIVFRWLVYMCSFWSKTGLMFQSSMRSGFPGFWDKQGLQNTKREVSLSIENLLTFSKKCQTSRHKVNIKKNSTKPQEKKNLWIWKKNILTFASS